MDNANPLVRRIGKLLREAVIVNTTFGRNLFGDDERQHYRVMGRTAGHPNVGAAIVVSLEPKSAQDVADVAAEASPWMPIETLTIHETGGTLQTAARGVEIAQKLYQHLSAARRRRCNLSEITLGTECGGSDTTSGLVANPVTGVLSDRIVDAGGVVLFSETMEIVGAEHLLARRAANARVRKKLLGAVARTMDYAHQMGMDIIGCNPTEDNIQGGLSSIEEKSLGAVKKAGHARYRGRHRSRRADERARLRIPGRPERRGRERHGAGGVRVAGHRIQHGERKPSWASRLPHHQGDGESPDGGAHGGEHGSGHQRRHARRTLKG